MACRLEGHEMAERDIVFVMRLARALHRHGAPAHRLEEAIGRVSDQRGLEGQFFSTPTSIFAAFGPTGRQQMVLERIEPGDVHLGKLAALDDLLDDIGSGRTEGNAAEARLAEIEAAGGEPNGALLVLAHGFVAGAGAFFLRGSGADVAASALIGLLVGAVVVVLGRANATRRLVDLLAATFAALGAGLAGARFAEVHPYVVTLAALLVLLPGLNFTTATAELASRHFVAGASRFAGTVVVLVTLGFGAALGDGLAARLSGAGSAATPLVALPLVWALPALLLSSIGLAVTFRARRRDFVWILLGAVVTYGAVQLAARALGGAELGALVGALVLGLFGSGVARVFRRPAALVTVPGLVLLVPGSIGFRSVASLVEQDTLSGIQTAFSMLFVAVAIVTGLLVANAVLPSRRAV